VRAAEAAHPGERLPPPGNPVLYVVGDGVKLRAGPRGNARVLGQLGDGPAPGPQPSWRLGAGAGRREWPREGWVPERNVSRRVALPEIAAADRAGATR
jgi:hypothetical protein